MVALAPPVGLGLVPVLLGEAHVVAASAAFSALTAVATLALTAVAALALAPLALVPAVASAALAPAPAAATVLAIVLRAV